jgi:hypothetical protein
LEYRYADVLNFEFFKLYLNIKEKYCITVVLRYSEKNHDSLKPLPNAGNLVKLSPLESQTKPQYLDSNIMQTKKIVSFLQIINFHVAFQIR